jgi:hypothetical protein
LSWGFAGLALFWAAHLCMAFGYGKMNLEITKMTKHPAVSFAALL